MDIDTADLKPDIMYHMYWVIVEVSWWKEDGQWISYQGQN